MMLPGRRRTARSPALSVVVPVFNVEPYVTECLDSIKGQTLRDVEVIVVDDGSTDGSGALVSDYASRHSDIRVLRTSNHGLGAARNAGLQVCRGRYVTFVDADDTVPPQAFELQVETLEDTSSDFAIGSLRRMMPNRSVEPPWLRRLHHTRRTGISVREFPDILLDVFACNKVFRRSFWDRAGLRFVEGVRYEDQVVLTEAYLKAQAFDVLIRPVYNWRIRDDRTSITQRRHELDDLRDRIVTKQMSTSLVENLGTDQVRSTWYRKVLPMDMPLYFWEILGCDDDYWNLLRHGVRELWAAGPPLTESTLRTHMRLVAWLVEHDRREEAETVLRYVEDHGREPPQARRDGQVVSVLPYLDDPDSIIPKELYRLADHESVLLGDTV